MGKRTILKQYAAGRRDFSGTVWFRTDLAEAQLPEIDLQGAYLYEVELSGADLSGANLARVDAPRLNLRGTDLTGADLSGVALDSVGCSGHLTFDEDTKFPEDDALLQGTTMDGMPFTEWRDTLRALGPNPSAATLKIWEHMHNAALIRAVRTAAEHHAPTR